jgi:hypothetical protein
VSTLLLVVLEVTTARLSRLKVDDERDDADLLSFLWAGRRATIVGSAVCACAVGWRWWRDIRASTASLSSSMNRGGWPVSGSDSSCCPSGTTASTALRFLASFVLVILEPGCRRLSAIGFVFDPTANSWPVGCGVSATTTSINILVDEYMSCWRT